jgi:subtilisin family serine protease
MRKRHRPWHRRYYRGYQDIGDGNGHGSHVAGTLAGAPTDVSLAAGAGATNFGLAPDAKLAVFGAPSPAVWLPQRPTIRLPLGACQLLGE